MSSDLLIASTNPGKIIEYRALFENAPLRLLSLSDVGLGDVDVEEPFETFIENARHKALSYARMAKRLTLADDSGLCVDALDGRPGVFSARYAPTAPERIQKLLGELQGILDERRTARFVCVIAVADPHAGTVEIAEGTVEGRIAHQPGQGTTGFGYDPIFIPEGYGVPMSDVSPETKNAIDHRGQAARAILPYLLSRMGT